MRFEKPLCESCGGLAVAELRRLVVRVGLVDEAYGQFRQSDDIESVGELTPCTASGDRVPDGTVELVCAEGHTWESHLESERDVAEALFGNSRSSLTGMVCS